MRCENCGQTVLGTDTVCWHCGQVLPKQTTPAAPPKPAIKRKENPEISLSGIPVYGGLTAVVIICLLLVTRSLGQKPFVIIGPESKPEWTHVTDQQMRFTFDLPPDWLWIEKGNTGQVDQFEEVVAQNPRFSAVFTTLPARLTDPEWLIVTAHTSFTNPTERFGLVARSPELFSFSAEEINALAETTVPTVRVLETAVTENLSNEPQSHMVLEVDTADGAWKCQQDVVKGPTESYLVIVCATRNEYARQGGELEGIVQSFQPLIP